MDYDSEGSQYVIFMSIKKDSKIEDVPIQGFAYEYEAQIFLEGYVNAIINHTGDASYGEVKGQFTIRNVAGEQVKTNKNKELEENGK